MAASYISVPRDLTKVKSKVMFNLTKRQLLCFGAAALLGVPSFFLIKSVAATSTALGSHFGTFYRGSIYKAKGKTL